MVKVQGILTKKSVGHRVHSKKSMNEEKLSTDIDDQRYHIAKDERNFVHLSHWLNQHAHSASVKASTDALSYDLFYAMT
jgi:hypothetical protein